MPATTQSITNNSILAATLARRSPGYVSQVGNQIALWYFLKRKGRYTPATGEAIEYSVEYKINTDDPSYSGMEPLGLQEYDNLTKLRAEWKQYQRDIVISGLDMKVRNTGPEALIKLAKQKETSALTGLQNAMNQHFYLDGTGNAGKRVTGLGAHISETPTTGTINGVNRATAGNTWAQNQSIDINAAHYTGSATLPLFTLKDQMELLRMYCGRTMAGGVTGRFPDYILTSETGYLYYSNHCTRIGQRFVNVDVADAGFDNLKFMKTTMVADQDCPADAGGDQKYFFINSQFMELYYAPAYNFSTLGMERAMSQDGFYDRILWAGELVCNLWNKQGLLQGVKTAA